MFVRRGRRFQRDGAADGPAPITGEPTPPAVPPTPAPVVPAPFDPASLSPEAQAWIAEERKRIAAQEGGKARDVARDNARKEALAAFNTAMGIEDGKPVDPAQVAQELTAARAEAKTLKIDAAVDRACKTPNADADIVGALLAKHHAAELAALDPTAGDFATRVQTLVADLVKSNPRVLLDAGTPAGGQAPVNGGFNGAPSDGQRPSMSGAIANWYGGRR